MKGPKQKEESWLSPSTNVADVYPEDRMNTYFVFDQARNVTDYFSVDFTLDELRALAHRQRFGQRDPNYDDQLGLVTLNELIDIVQAANGTVGMFVELKDPQWVNSLDILQQSGTTFEQLVIDILESRGYSSQSDPCCVMSFNTQSLLDLSTLTSLPLMKATSAPVTDALLAFYATFLYGIVPNKELIVVTNARNQITAITDLGNRTHSYGLRMFPFTARNEYEYLAYDYEQDPYLEYETLLTAADADGVVTDFPGTFRRYLDSVYDGCS